ncbi:hypothetical protein ATANTOWER_024929 [Ataeniobius toweri]|uniref:Uncharacterized protein n=1 Tax=Ataeniobius toweri TaxID=208326 RepID=A0ABU7A8Q9_9TELE|nr:hypothetical protein [Ataeniobius toweri]
MSAATIPAVLCMCNDSSGPFSFEIPVKTQITIITDDVDIEIVYEISGCDTPVIKNQTDKEHSSYEKGSVHMDYKPSLILYSFTIYHICTIVLRYIQKQHRGITQTT